LTAKNVGKGRSWETLANLRNLSGDGLLLHDGRFDVSNMMPGDVRKVAFTFDVEPQLADPEAKIELSIHDQDLREGALEKIRIPVLDPIAVAPTSGAYRPKGSGADLFSAPEPSGRFFARLLPGASALATGTA